MLWIPVIVALMVILPFLCFCWSKWKFVLVIVVLVAVGVGIGLLVHHLKKRKQIKEKVDKKEEHKSSL